MKLTVIIMTVFISVLFLFSGCISTGALTRIETLTERISEIEQLRKEKIERIKTGELTLEESLAFLKLAEIELKHANTELNIIKETEDIGWPELIGTIIFSLIGGGSVIRAWRGPTHKNLSIAPPQ